jgi:glycosyltransferase involved in cell wall biosynthesis
MGPVFADADALLVHLRDDPLFTITIPSKTQAYLVTGKPILMGVRGDAAAMIEEAGAGFPFEPENVGGLVDAVLRLRALSNTDRQAMGRAGAAFYRDRLSLQSGVASFEKVLKSIARRSSAAPAALADTSSGSCGR